MGKLKNNLLLKTKTKKEKNFEKLKSKYNNLSLTYEEYSKCPKEKRIEYLQKILYKKYNKNIHFYCECCAITVAFNDNGYITDDELLNNEQIMLCFKHK